MIDRHLPRVITPLLAQDGKQPVTVEPDKIHVLQASAALHLEAVPVLKISELTPEIRDSLRLDGKVILVSTAVRDKELDHAIAASKALVEIVVYKSPPFHLNSRLLTPEEAHSSAPPVLQVESSELSDAIDTDKKLTLSLDVPAPEDQPVTLKNVIGVLPGSDPELKSACVMLTAHYDHIGTTATSQGLALSKAIGNDIIYNGANDDGSGTVSVIEIARALAQLHPKRSILFMTFFGEERGLIGSTYYGHHPVFPVSKTIADINLEQLGRTDSSEGPEFSNATVTGYDYSGVTRYLEDAGKATGVKIYRDESASDEFFLRSDNAALAELGIPAHTVATAIEYPDYHAVGDEWQKIDYDNMAKVDRTIALAILNLANTDTPPAWNEANPKTGPFREAQHTR